LPRRLAFCPDHKDKIDSCHRGGAEIAEKVNFLICQEILANQKLSTSSG